MQGRLPEKTNLFPFTVFGSIFAFVNFFFSLSYRRLSKNINGCIKIIYIAEREIVRNGLENGPHDIWLE